jgi:hypothetical protein
MVCSLWYPEFLFVVSLLSRTQRKWVFNLIENSDGKPHHNDGLFLILVNAAVVSFKISFIAALQTIYNGKQLLEVAITFALIGGALLGVRISLMNKGSIKDQIDDLIKK